MNACISACQNFDKRTHKGLERKRKERLGTHTRVKKRIRDLCKLFTWKSMVHFNTELRMDVERLKT